MKLTFGRFVAIVLAAGLLGSTYLAGDADARAGSSRSIGSRGSRSYSRPVSPSTQPAPSMAPQPAPQPMTPPPFQQPQPAGGGFLRSMAGGLVGGMLGGMLFRSLGFGGGGWGGGMGGSGIGLFEIILIGGLLYLIYRMVKGRQSAAPTYQSRDAGVYGGYQEQAAAPVQPAAADLATGLAHIRQMDPGFSEERFADQAMDIFFKIQGAWMNRELAPVNQLLSDEIRRVFQEDLDRLRREGKINRLENIAVRNVEVVEAWQEQGQDFVTTQIYANLLDYTTDEAGQLLGGSKTDPVKFEEFWTFSRPVGSSEWKLCAIDQK